MLDCPGGRGMSTYVEGMHICFFVFTAPLTTYGCNQILNSKIASHPSILRSHDAPNQA